MKIRMHYVGDFQAEELIARVAVQIESGLIDGEEFESGDFGDPERLRIVVKEKLIVVAKSSRGARVFFDDDEDHADSYEEFWNIPDFAVYLEVGKELGEPIGDRKDSAPGDETADHGFESRGVTPSVGGEIDGRYPIDLAEQGVDDDLRLVVDDAVEHPRAQRNAHGDRGANELRTVLARREYECNGQGLTGYDDEGQEPRRRVAGDGEVERQDCEEDEHAGHLPDDSAGRALQGGRVDETS